MERWEIISGELEADLSRPLERLGFGRVLSRTSHRVAAAFSARGCPPHASGTHTYTAHYFSIRNLRLIFAAANHDEAHSGWQAASECCGHGTAVT